MNTRTVHTIEEAGLRELEGKGMEIEGYGVVVKVRCYLGAEDFIYVVVVDSQNWGNDQFNLVAIRAVSHSPNLAELQRSLM